MTASHSKARRLGQFFSGNASASSKPPFLLKYRSSTPFIIFTIALAVFTDIFLYGLIVPVIPYSITVQAGIAEDRVQQWTAILLACYNATLFVGSPLVGWYADNSNSRRLPLLLGLLALAGATVMLCVGKTIALFVVGRLLQGLSAAVVWSVGLALLVDTLGRNIGVAMGYVSIAMSAGLLISPTVGGALYAGAGYYPVYYLAFAIIFCDIVLRLVLIEKKVAKQWITDEDYEARNAMKLGGGADNGNGLLAASDVEKGGISGDSAAEGDVERGPALPAVPQAATARPAACNAKACKPARHPYWELIKSRRVLAALAGTVFEAGAMFSFDTVVPIFVKDTFHWNSTAAGLIFICIMVPGLAAPLVGKLADRYGARWPSFAGFAAAVPLLICLRFVTDNTIGHKVLFGALLVLLGLALCFSNTPLMAEITYAIEEKEARRPGMWGEKGVYGIAYGLFTCAFSLGGFVGSLMSGYLVAGPGWGTMTWALSIWCAAGGVIVLFFLGGSTEKRKALQEDGVLPGSGNKKEKGTRHEGEAVSG
jgi:MFS family permease